MKHVVAGVLLCVALALVIGVIECKEAYTGTYGLFNGTVIEKSL